jgi:hypothetical protein
MTAAKGDRAVVERREQRRWQAEGRTFRDYKGQVGALAPQRRGIGNTRGRTLGGHVAPPRGVSGGGPMVLVQGGTVVAVGTMDMVGRVTVVRRRVN